MLECLINYYSDGNKAKFSARIGVKPQTVSSWIARNTFDAEVIYANCSEISADWLLSNGDGEMLKSINNIATASGNSSVAVTGNNNSNISSGDTAVLQERVKSLETIVAEKERLITVLMERK